MKHTDNIIKRNMFVLTFLHVHVYVKKHQGESKKNKVIKNKDVIINKS
jgi:hypothetical protein